MKTVSNLSIKVLLAALFLTVSYPLFAEPTAAFLSTDKTLITLEESAEIRVQNTHLRVRLTYEATDRSQAVAQEFLNEAIENALLAYQSEKALSLWTTDYRVYQPYESGRKQGRWVASQVIVLEGLLSDRISEVVLELQKQGFALTQQSYFLDEVTRGSYHAALTEQAIRKVEISAEKVAKQLKKKQVHIQNLDVHKDRGGAPKYALSEARSRSDSTPSFKPDDARVSVSVRAGVLLY